MNKRVKIMVAMTPTEREHIEKDQIPEDAWELLSDQLTSNRREKILRTVSQRTHWVRLVVQDVHQPHNISACIRSAEAFGVQNIDVVTLKTKFDASTVAKGVDEWVDIHRHPDISQCVRSLKEQGYVVAAAFPHGKAVALDQLPLDKPLAVVFGNEHEGLASEWRDLADVCFTIPMSGIVESLNISVSAAITLHVLTEKCRRAVDPGQYFVAENERKKILNRWICRQITSWHRQLPILRSRVCR